MTTKPALQKILKGILHKEEVKDKYSHGRMEIISWMSISANEE
jgi:hypothetical protein